MVLDVSNASRRPAIQFQVRWMVAALLACASALSYLDRQSFPVAVTVIQHHIPISDRQYSELQMLFLLAYSVMYAGGGAICDRLGSRLGYTVLIVVWSAATTMHGFMSSVLGLGVARLFLGLGEGGGFPCSAKVVSEWFPEEERSFAFGIFNTGSSIGAVIAPPLIALIILRLDWRWVFFLTGTAGLIWAFAWWRLYELPEKHKQISLPELQFIQRTRAAVTTARRTSWLALFRERQVWVLMAAKFLTDAAWFFFIFWLPKYLADVRHLDIKHIGYFAWIPYAAASIGSLVGGWLSSFLIRHRVGVDRSRKICLTLSALLMPVSIFITHAPLQWTIVFFSIAFLGHQFWSTILQTLPADRFPSAVVASVAGLMGAVGSFGAMLFDLGVGEFLSKTHDYSPIFVVAGLLHPLALVLLLRLPRRRPANTHLF
jgi:MFS transporter, ACS family, hexuronate transporter